MQLVEGLKDGPLSIFIGPSNQKSSRLGEEWKGRIVLCSHWSKKKCQSWYTRKKWCDSLKMEKMNLFWWWKLMTFHPTLWMMDQDWGMKGKKSRCGRGNEQFYCIRISPLGLIGGWTIPLIIIGSKIGRSLIGGGRIGKDCCVFIGQGQEVHLGRWKVPWKGKKLLASDSNICMRIEMYVMWEP